LPSFNKKGWKKRKTQAADANMIMETLVSIDHMANAEVPWAKIVECPGGFKKQVLCADSIFYTMI
jgi:hypothetical protein